MTVFCEECKYIPNCNLAKHEEVDTCKKGEKELEEEVKQGFRKIAENGGKVFTMKRD